jgi:hypothetical protein
MKYAVTVLLSLALINSAFAIDADKSGRTLTMANGNEITFTSPKEAPVTIVDKQMGTKDVTRFEQVKERPYTLNGKEIVYDFKATPALLDVAKQTQLLIGKELKAATDKLSEGCYQITMSDIVVDEKGNVAYYTKAEVKEAEPKDFSMHKVTYHTISAEERSMMEQAMRNVLSTLKAEPLLIDGKAVPYIIHHKSVLAKS